MRPGIVIAGASLAGLRVAEGLRSSGYDGGITMVGAERRLPYDRPPLSKNVLTGDADIESVTFRDAEWFADSGIVIRTGESALSIDARRRRLVTDRDQIEYSHLVIATGGRAKNPFGEVPGVLTLRTVDDAVRLRNRLTRAEHVVVIGGGFIGLEVASSARTLGIRTTVIEAAAVPLSRNLGDRVATAFVSVAHEHGVDIRCGSGVRCLEGGDHVRAVILNDGSRIEADLVLVGVGSAPNAEWLQDSVVETSRLGVHCDAYGSAGPEVWAVGDVSAWVGDSGHRHRHEHWTAAVDQARVLAHNLLSADRRRVETAGYVWSDQFDRRISIIGNPGGNADVEVLSAATDIFAAIYHRAGIVVGACVVGQPRLMLLARRWVATEVTIDTVRDDYARIPSPV